MKIRTIETAVLDANFEWVLVKITTDEGVTGIGEAHWGYGVVEAIHRFSHHLIGKDPRQVDRLWWEMYEVVSGAAWQGATVCAMNGIEVALWDLLGKVCGQPVWQLLGGKFRDEIRILLDLHAGESYKLGDGTKVAFKGNRAEAYTPEAYAARVKEAKRRGFDAIKFDIDIPTLVNHDRFNHQLTPANLDRIVSIVAAVREAVGNEVDVAIDCHWHFNTGDAIRLARALEPYDLLWLEDQAFMAAEGALPTAGKAGAPESGSSPAGRALGQGLGSPPLAATLNRRFGAPEEIAALVSFLVSDENTHIVGEVIRADGGRSISRLADPY